MECSVCHSTNLVKVSLAYEQGLSDYQGQSRSRGLFAGTGGLSLWGGRTTSTGTSQTRLSARLSPPTKLSYWKVLVCWFVCLFAVGPLSASLNGMFRMSAILFQKRFTMFGYIWTALLILVMCLIWRYNHLVVPRRRKHWDRLFMCRRCGATLQARGYAIACKPQRDPELP